MSFALIIRRLGVTLALTIVLTCVLAFFSEAAAGLLFLPSWIVLLMSWPYLSRRLGFDFPKAPAPRESRPRRTNGKSLVITGVLAIVLSALLALITDATELMGILFVPFWLALYYGWPYLSRRLPFLDFEKTPANPAPMRPLWLRLIRGTVALVGSIVLVMCLMSLTVVVPIAVCFHRAKKAHDAIHVGMTVSEVLHTAGNGGGFQASSEFPHDDDADPDKIPAMSLGWTKDGTYHTYDPATRQTLRLSESQAVALLHARLHDGYRWHLRYTYVNMTPMHVSYSVVFGPDERVEEVKPVYGWD